MATVMSGIPARAGFCLSAASWSLVLLGDEQVDALLSEIDGPQGVDILVETERGLLPIPHRLPLCDLMANSCRNGVHLLLLLQGEDGEGGEILVEVHVVVEILVAGG